MKLKIVHETEYTFSEDVLLELNLPNCGFLTVTDADISPDLKDGRVYVSVIGTPAQRRHALGELQRQHGHIQHQLASRIVLKYTPRLHFILDNTETNASRIERLLDELEETENP